MKKNRIRSTTWSPIITGGDAATVREQELPALPPGQRRPGPTWRWFLGRVNFYYKTLGN